MRKTARIVDPQQYYKSIGVAVLLIILGAGVGLAQQASHSKQTQKEQVRAVVSARVQAREVTLRKRVQDLYGLLQLGRWDQAESFIAPDSRDNFRKQPKSPFLGFEVQSVRVSPQAQAALVVVNMRIMNTLSPTPIAMPQTSRWKWIQNDWYLEVPNPAEQGEGLKTAFGGSASSRSAAAPRPEDLKFKGHRFKLGLVHTDEVRVARFPFTNVTDHTVTLSSVNTFCDCLQVKTEKKEFKPGESGELAIAFDPKGFERDYVQTILVKTDPGDLTTYLTVTAFVVPPELHPAGKGAAGKPASPAINPAADE